MDDNLNLAARDALTSLLELAACDNLQVFKQFIDRELSLVDEIGLWRVQQSSSNQMVLEHMRTPLMVAATCGSLDVLKHILSSWPQVDVDLSCGADLRTPLHCAASSGSRNAVDIVKLLLAFGANPNSVDANGRHPLDVINIVPLMSQETENELNMLLTLTDDATRTSNLPKIMDSFYCTDEFRMSSFKVRPCWCTDRHKWKKCPFGHKEEKARARRRDPKKHRGDRCMSFDLGNCPLGDDCEKAHGDFEHGLHPDQYRTQLCNDHRLIGCRRNVCFFAHTKEELRARTKSGIPEVRRSPEKSIASLLKLAAKDELKAFEKLVDKEPALIEEVGKWHGSNQTVPKDRTPLMVAATCGSLNVLQSILCSWPQVDVNLSCGADLSTALHCASSSGSKDAIKIVTLLLAFGANSNLVDTYGRRPRDVIRVSLKSHDGKHTLHDLLSTDAASSSSSNFQEYLSDKFVVETFLMDEFRMFSYKVRLCWHTDAHNREKCLFAHQGEKDKRRDPRKHNYDSMFCREYYGLQGVCQGGDECKYAHGDLEFWLHPNRYRTRCCYDKKNCEKKGDCFFAHNKPRPKTQGSGHSDKNVRADKSNLQPSRLPSSSSSNHACQAHILFSSFTFYAGDPTAHPFTGGTGLVRPMTYQEALIGRREEPQYHDQRDVGRPNAADTFQYGLDLVHSGVNNPN